MPTPRVPMSKIRRVLQLLHEAKLSQREVARVTGLSKSGVGEIASYARAAGLAWEQARQLDDQALQARMHPPPAPRSARHLEPDWAQVHQQLKQPAVTLQLLWEEYRQANGEQAYKYSAFCEKYARWARHLKRSMRQVHKAGERLFVDYAGQTVPVVSRTGSAAPRPATGRPYLVAAGGLAADAARLMTRGITQASNRPGEMVQFMAVMSAIKLGGLREQLGKSSL